MYKIEFLEMMQIRPQCFKSKKKKKYIKIPLSLEQTWQEKNS